MEEELELPANPFQKFNFLGFPKGCLDSGKGEGTMQMIMIGARECGSEIKK